MNDPGQGTGSAEIGVCPRFWERRVARRAKLDKGR